MDMSFLESVGKLSPPVLLVLAFNVLGAILRKVNYFPNKYIPLLLFSAGGVIYPFIGTPQVGIQYPTVNLVMIGCFLGGAAVGLNQLARQVFGKNVDSLFETDTDIIKREVVEKIENLPKDSVTPQIIHDVIKVAEKAEADTATDATKREIKP